MRQATAWEWAQEVADVDFGPLTPVHSPILTLQPLEHRFRGTGPTVPLS